MLKGRADILVENSSRENWVGVVLEKKQEILPDNEMQNKIFSMLDESIFKKLSEISINTAFSLNVERKMKCKYIIRNIPVIGHFLKVLYKKYKQKSVKKLYGSKKNGT